jgi:hypothetical protein
LEGIFHKGYGLKNETFFKSLEFSLKDIFFRIDVASVHS